MSAQAATATRGRRILLPRPHGPARRWSLHAPTAPRVVLVVDVRRETDDAITLVLHPEDGRPIPFRAGQYLTHCFDVDGQPQRRAYSISSAEGQDLACTIKALPDGRVSQHVLRTVRPGTRYSVIGPTGDFVLPESAEVPMVLLAGGSGITPVISLIETALARSPERRCNRSRSRAASGRSRAVACSTRSSEGCAAASCRRRPAKIARSGSRFT